MYDYTLNDDNVSLNDYSIEIDAQYYSHDYDEIDFENQIEENTESNILFE